MTIEEYKVIENYMLENADNNAHDYLHIYRVLNNALKIAKKEKSVNYDILIISCLLHDISRNEQLENPNICHAQAGSIKAYNFLKKLGYEETICEEVKKNISSHRFRSNNQPKTIEGKILFDADKLDVVGAMGISRTLIYKSSLNQPIYNLDFEGKIDYGLNLTAKDSFLKEYNFKLKKLYNRFYTKGGKQLSKKYKRLSENFYNQLLEQIQTDELDNYKKQILKKINKS